MADETECVKLHKGKIRIKQTGVVLPHHIIEQYSFYFPELSSVCECICDAGTCSSSTKEKEINCGRHQMPNSTCSNIRYRGEDFSGCPELYELCCQIYFTIHDPKQMYQAYQLKLEQHFATSLDITTEIGGENKTRRWTIPNWVENLIINENIMLIFNWRKRITSKYDLTNQWIYYSEESKNFYLTDEINEKGQIDFDKLGWFQKDDNNIMARILIPKDNVEHIFAFQLKHCNNPTTNYELVFNARNFYHNNELISPTNGELLSKVYGDKWHVSENDVFDEKLAVITKTEQTLPINFTVCEQVLITFSSTIIEGRTPEVIMNISKIPDGKYEVIMGYIRYKKMHSFSINASTPLPHIITFALPLDVIDKTNNITCVYESSKVATKVCVATSNKSNSTNKPYSKDVEDGSEEQKSQQDSHFAMYKIALITSFCIIVPVLITVLWKKTRKYRCKSPTSNISETFKKLKNRSKSTASPSTGHRQTVMPLLSFLFPGLVNYIANEMTPDEWNKLSKRLLGKLSRRLPYDKKKNMQQNMQNLIQHWAKKKGQDATKPQLILALRKIGKTHLANNISSGNFNWVDSNEALEDEDSHNQ